MTHTVKHFERFSLRPISELRFNSGFGGGYEVSDPVLLRFFYEESGVISFGVSRIWCENGIEKVCDLPYAERKRVTHFMYLDNLTVPESESVR